MIKEERGYTGPNIVARETAELLGDRKESRILDLAAGTGLVAREVGYLIYLPFKLLSFIWMVVN